MRCILIFLLALSCAAHGAEPELLEPDKAFRFSAQLRDARTIEVNYRIAPGYYLYRDKFRFTVAPAGAKLGSALLPAGLKHRDEFFGEMEIYRGDLRVVLPLEFEAASPPALVLTALSQGCADVGVCYVPHEQRAELRLAAAGGAASDLSLGQLFGLQQGPAGADDARIARVFEGGFWLVIAFFLGCGLLLSLTPCVLPMVPILSGVIVGTGGAVTRTRGFLLAAVYVLGMAVTYAVAGVAAGLSGAMLSATLQSPWVLGAFAAVFVALAGAMFGLYQLQLPVRLQNRLASASNRLHGGHVTGVFSMGVLAALIVGPCVAAPLAGALLYISQSRDVVLGGSALFAMALGMQGNVRTRTVRVATYNIHRCRGLDGRTLPSRTAEVIRSLDPDIIALQEVIGAGPKSPGHAEELGALLGMGWVMAPARHLRGAMFGNVPRALWSRWIEVDDRHRIPLACRALLVRDLDGRDVLFEAGIGTFFEPKYKDRYGVREDEHVLLRSLDEVGISHEDVGAVVLSHLHFDHAGGLLSAWSEGREPELLFPNARFYVGGKHWRRAQNPHPRDRASFIPALNRLLSESGRLKLVEDDTDVRKVAAGTGQRVGDDAVAGDAECSQQHRDRRHGQPLPAVHRCRFALCLWRAGQPG